MFCKFYDDVPIGEYLKLLAYHFNAKSYKLNNRERFWRNQSVDLVKYKCIEMNAMISSQVNKPWY